MLARVTVYWASGGSGSDPWTRKHVAASGARLRDGHCAVDPRRIPYKSRVVLPDATLTAVDTGGAVRSRHAARKSGRSSAERNAIVIDRFFETKAQAVAWARKNPEFMMVRVFSPNENLATVVQTRSPKPMTVFANKSLVNQRALTRTSAQSGRTAVAATAISPWRVPKKPTSSPAAGSATNSGGKQERIRSEIDVSPRLKS